MAHVPSHAEQVRRYKARIKRNKIIGIAAQLILRVIMLSVTLVCFYKLVFDDDAAKIKGIAAAFLFVLFYAQCAALPMLGLSLFKARRISRLTRLTAISLMICAPLYFVVLVFSLIPITVWAVFFITVFPIIVLNALPMGAIYDELSYADYPKRLFWTIQLTVQLGLVAVGQLAGTAMFGGWGR
ncbi:MAG: hypothetical protein IJ428_03520 [Clostridia bacterium]|nr:hypothetical protein [Clostridia bacterium]